ncbi:phosphatidylethanolamine-binding protein [Catovirus CTV1]|uniref:Phosphatidylethanolamine-binding protein n=1 Tax=Catovirus CTV1 TaxID=1977631 RepID=A0A1V0SBZ7_9VIRU|nr:phosphatidylethanolamine-binding protein [Catovirus CTV1]
MELKILLNNSNIIIKNNEFISLNKIKDKPLINYNYEKEKKYTLILVDQDAPSHINPIFKYYLHWIIINIDDSGKRNEIVPHESPNPPKNSGIYRYNFMLYEQNNIIDSNNVLLFINNRRTKFSPIQFTTLSNRT